MTQNSEGNESREDVPILRRVLDLNQHLLGIAALCYIAGFVITNLYLGSFGITNLDILRVRYILTGLLFAFFIGIIAFPIYGLIHILRQRQDGSVATILLVVFNYSMSRYVSLFFLVTAIGLFAATTPNPAARLLGSSGVLDWGDWLDNELYKVLMQSLRLTVILLLAGLALAFLLFVIILLINPKNKDGVRASRKDQLREFWTGFRSKEAWIKYSKLLVIIFVGLIGIGIVSSLLEFVGPIESLRISPGWMKFIGVAFLFYAMVVIYLVMMLRLWQQTGDSDMGSGTEDDPLDKYYRWLYLVALAIMLIIPIYTLSIYPEIPQRIGGGEMVKAKIQASGELSSLFSDKETETHILDRTSKGIIVLIVNEKQNSQQIVELMESQIESIVYEIPNAEATDRPSSVNTPASIGTPDAAPKSVPLPTPAASPAS